jgi:hypothetical protein
MKKHYVLDEKTPVGALIPYYMKNTLDPSDPTGGREFFHFNDITRWGDMGEINLNAPLYDPFSMNYSQEIPSGYVQMLHEVEKTRN